MRGYKQKEDGRWYCNIPEGYEASVEGNEIVLKKKRWKPREGVVYYSVDFSVFYLLRMRNPGLFVPDDSPWRDTQYDNLLYDNGLVFKTREECQEFCDKMNKDIAAIISQQTEEDE